MKYISTRNGSLRLSAAQAIAAGLSPEGGLFLPEELPSFQPDEIQEMMGMDYQSRAAFVLTRFLPGFSREELEEYTGKAYASPKFPQSPAPVVSLKSGPHILELFHGPTCAFKDFALQILPFFADSLFKENRCPGNGSDPDGHFRRYRKSCFGRLCWGGRDKNRCFLS